MEAGVGGLRELCFLPFYLVFIAGPVPQERGWVAMPSPLFAK